MKTSFANMLCGLAIMAGCADVDDQLIEQPSEQPRAERTHDASDPSAALMKEAERFLAAVGARAGSEWADARLTGEAMPLYRPDLDSPAYYELPVYPQGFIVMATGDHDWTVSHWATKGTSPSVRLREEAAASGDKVARVFKLDALSYAAEDESENLVAQLGALPQRIDVDLVGSELGGELYEQSWVPEIGTNNEVVGGQILTREIDPSVTIDAEAGPLWATDGAIVGRTIVAGDEVTTEKAFAPATKPRPFESWQALKADYAVTFRAQLDELRTSAATSAGTFAALAPTPIGDGTASAAGDGFAFYFADGNAAELTYGQLGSWTWPNVSSCASGCGPTAWSMLFAWADRLADSGSAKWQNHWGIYRQDGGYGTDVAAPTDDDFGTNNMTMQIRSLVKTFCLGGSGATYPGDMIGAWNYLIGRDYSPLHVSFNSFGFTNYGNTASAVNTILYEKSPVIIGVGWLTHYPLAHGVGFHPYYGTYFIVNQGWHAGGAEGVPASSWFHGQLVWVP